MDWLFADGEHDHQDDFINKYKVEDDVECPYKEKIDLSKEEVMDQKTVIFNYTTMNAAAKLPDGYSWYSEQIAGHNISVVKEGRPQIGIIKKDDRHILKILMPFKRGDCELWFYKSMNEAYEKLGIPEYSLSDMEKVFRVFVPYIPRFCGHEYLELDGEKRRFLMLEDVLFPFKNPCVMDVKIGKVSYDPHASEAKKQSETAKCPYQMEAGFRPLGYRIYKKGELKTRDRHWGKMINKENAEKYFLEYLDADKENRAALEFIKRLKDLKEILEKQTDLQFYASSLLFIYEGDTELDFRCRMKMIDFSHVFNEPNKKDENFIAGIDSLIDIFRGICGFHPKTSHSILEAL